MRNDEIFTFRKAIPDITEWGVEYKTTCPLCGGTITAIRSINNGHLLAECDGCRWMVIENGKPYERGFIAGQKNPLFGKILDLKDDKEDEE